MNKVLKKILALIPDRPYLKIMYYYRMHKRLNLKNPKTFNEKIQWIKLYDRKDLYTAMVDKYEAKKYVAQKIGEEYIIPNYGVWDRVEDIDFNSLPDQFVLKCTHDSGGLVICKDKSKLDMEKLKKKIDRVLKSNYYWHGREWPYKNVKPRIIAEQFMEDKCNEETNDGDAGKEDKGLINYKFFCFNGEPRFLYLSQDFGNHDSMKVSFVTMDWKFAPYKRSDFESFDRLPEKPVKFDEMVQLSKVLSKDYNFLRVDLYQINNKIYFSELTFSPTSGFIPFENTEHDLEIGEMFELPSEKRKGN